MTVPGGSAFCGWMRIQREKRMTMRKYWQSFANRDADILIGTQMIVKGHDFPGVTLMGVLAADLSFHGSGLQKRRAYVPASGTGGRKSQAEAVRRERL